jgi:hypothetical protein
MIETLVPNDVVGEQSGFLRIRPVIVDTSFLLADVLGSTHTGCRSTFLEAVEFGGLRPFAAHHVWAEMGRKVADVPSRHGLDPQFAMKIWWEAYVPRIRFVDVAGLPVPSADEILERDPSDAPTCALAGLLAPVVVLAGDRDLRDLGVAAQSYQAVVRDAGTLAVVSEGSWASFVALRGVAGLVGWGYGSVSSWLRNPLGRAAALVGAFVLLFTSDRWMPAVEERAPHWWSQTRSFLTLQMLPRIAELLSAYQLAAQGFEQASFETGDTSFVQRVARALAASANPLNRTQLARLLSPNESGAARRRRVRDLGPVLEKLNAFSSSPGGRWELGRAGVDFGGSSEPTVDLLAPARPPMSVGLTARRPPTGSAPLRQHRGRGAEIALTPSTRWILGRMWELARRGSPGLQLPIASELLLTELHQLLGERVQTDHHSPRPRRPVVSDPPSDHLQQHPTVREIHVLTHIDEQHSPYATFSPAQVSRFPARDAACMSDAARASALPSGARRSGRSESMASWRPHQGPLRGRPRDAPRVSSQKALVRFSATLGATGLRVGPFASGRSERSARSLCFPRRSESRDRFGDKGVTHLAQVRRSSLGEEPPQDVAAARSRATQQSLWR